MVRVAVVLASLLLLTSTAHAQRRVALVVGNAAYLHTPRLANPKNDAADVSTLLKKLGYEVVEGFDLDKLAFDRRIREFARALQGSAAGMFFYAGHGLQAAGQNYLVPVDAQLESASALEFEMIRLDLVQRVMEGEANTNILFLDACRDNPLARNLARAMGTRSVEIGRGLAAVESGIGTLISYSTQPGNVALDGAGRNSPFTEALVKHVSNASDDLSAILIAVRNDVMRVTQRKQVPWEHSALTGRFYFNAAHQAGPQPFTSLNRLSEAGEAWGATRESKSIAVLEAFIARYKDTFYAELARARMDELQKGQLEIAGIPKGIVQPTPFRPTEKADRPSAGVPAPPSVSVGKTSKSEKGEPQSAWVKLCEQASGVARGKEGKDEKKELNICLTHHERLDGNTGMVLVSAAVRQVGGQDKQHFMVMVPLSMMLQAGMRATIYPKDAWEKVQKNEKVDESKLKAVKLNYTLCHPSGCTAEMETTPELINNLQTGGGLVIFSINTSGAPVGYPVPLAGFGDAYAGPPVDNKKYGDARRALMQQIADRQQELAKQQKGAATGQPAPAPKNK